MRKIKYEAPSVIITKWEKDDIITTSGIKSAEVPLAITTTDTGIYSISYDKIDNY